MVKRRKEEKPDRHKKSLTGQIEDPETYGIRTEPRKKRPKSDGQQVNEEGEEKITAKILKEARKQTEDVEAENNLFAAHERLQQQTGATLASLDSDSDAEFDDPTDFEPWGDQEIEISPEDEAAMAAFMNPGAGIFKQRTLADLILEKIEAKKEEHARQADGNSPEDEPDVAPQIDEKVARVYSGVANILKRYTTGRLPKAFKIIPTLTNWEQILALTNPEAWSPHAVYQATRLFVSNLNAKMAQRFISLVLLPSVRDDIAENKRLHFALFQAVKKSTYKPDAFFKVDAMVDHFLRFRVEERTLPVVWHQSLLVFVQRYKHEIRKEDQQALLKLIKVQYHYQVSPEINRELDAARARGEKAKPVAAPVQMKSGFASFENPRNLPPVIMMEED